jgi:trans-2-enoyl-CoA reductase
MELACPQQCMHNAATIFWDAINQNQTILLNRKPKLIIIWKQMYPMMQQRVLQLWNQ